MVVLHHNQYHLVATGSTTTVCPQLRNHKHLPSCQKLGTSRAFTLLILPRPSEPEAGLDYEFIEMEKEALEALLWFRLRLSAHARALWVRQREDRHTGPVLHLVSVLRVSVDFMAAERMGMMKQTILRACNL